MDKIEMDNTFDAVLTPLRAGEFLRIQDGAGQSVAVFEGLVWVTQDGDPHDAFLARGETLTLDRPGLALIEALTNARLVVLEAESESTLTDEGAYV